MKPKIMSEPNPMPDESMPESADPRVFVRRNGERKVVYVVHPISCLTLDELSAITATETDALDKIVEINEAALAKTRGTLFNSTTGYGIAFDTEENAIKALAN